MLPSSWGSECIPIIGIYVFCVGGAVHCWQLSSYAPVKSGEFPSGP